MSSSPYLTALFRFSLLALLIPNLACFKPKAVRPMPLDIRGDAAQAERLWMFLPGRFDRVGDWTEKGFLVTAQEKQTLAAKSLWVGTDAHIGYYLNGSVAKQLNEDVLTRFPDQPVTVVGISMGGMGALWLARSFPERIDQIVLFAPYLGGRKVIERVIEGDLDDRPDDSNRIKALLANWRFLLSQPDADIHILAGDRDRLSPLLDVARERLAHLHYHEIPGGHDWETWNQLWRDWLTALEDVP